MKKTKSTYPVVANALIWAAMMIASSLLMSDPQQGMTMLIILIGGWFATHNLVAGSRISLQAECAFLRGLLRGNAR